jgi:hypothetical protein
MKRIMFIGAASAAALAGSIALAAPAMASNGNGPLTAVTHAADHPDTTSGPGGSALLDSPGYGPVWAFDNLAIKFIVTPDGKTNGYKVVVNSEGSFAGFADPGRDGATAGPSYGQPLTSNGDVKGTITYYVTSATPPDPANLPAQEPGVPTRDQTGLSQGSYEHLSGMISQLFDNQPTSGTGSIMDSSVPGFGDYNYSYQHGNYVQVTTGITGDVVGH